MKLLYEPVEGIERPQYGQHFSLSRIVDGRPQAVGFGMGGRRGPGAGHEADLPEGDYLLTSGNRLSDGSTPVTVNLFHVTPGETLEVPLKIETMPEEVKVLGNFSPRSVLSAVDAGYYVVAVLDVGLEPTNHLLNDLSAARTALEVHPFRPRGRPRPPHGPASARRRRPHRRPRRLCLPGLYHRHRREDCRPCKEAVSPFEPCFFAGPVGVRLFFLIFVPKH